MVRRKAPATPWEGLRLLGCRGPGVRAPALVTVGLTCRTLTRTMELVTWPWSSCCLAAKDRLMRVQATIPGRPLKNSLKSNHFPMRGLNSMPIM